MVRKYVIEYKKKEEEEGYLRDSITGRKLSGTNVLNKAKLDPYELDAYMNCA